ncbi:glycine betaine/L-proline ABC transporter substrate-binding protein ProX [Pseudomonas putida]|nr:glycine betaine/L-proline ABC transporter substrate-binding protein ProX [Pseudomonas putida]
MNRLTFPRKFMHCITGVALTCLSAYSIASADKPGEGIKVTPMFSSVAEERFRGEIAIAGLKELGYEVQEPKEAEYATMTLAVAYGDADFTVQMNEILHASFYEKAGGNDTMVKAGAFMPGILQGYLIDKKTADKYHIKYITDLQKPEIAKLFDSDGDGKADMTGCNPGWGCELVIAHHMKAYNLEKTVNVNQGSYFALMADTITKFKEGKPILYYTWIPQWISNVLVEGRDVVWLEVPKTDLPDGKNDVNTTYEGKNLGFAIDTANSVLNKEFAEKNPAALKFFSLAHITAADESAQNLKMQQGENKPADIKRHAQEWISAHQQEYHEWIEAARNSATVAAK